MALKQEDLQQEIKAKELLQKIYEQIRKESKNVFIFLKAFPLAKNINTKFKPVGKICRQPSNFKQRLTEELTSCKKVINISFDILTKNNLQKTINQGCRVLHISSEVFEDENKLAVEGSLGQVDEINLQQLKSMFTKPLTVDLVLIMIPNSYKIGKLLTEELEIPHCVVFDWPEYPSDGITSQIMLFYENSMQQFAISFYKFIVQGQTIREAYIYATQEMQELMHQQQNPLHQLSLSELDLQMYDPQIDFSLNGKGPILLPEDPNLHDTPLFCESKAQSVNIFNQSVVLKEGEIVDMSPMRCPTNLKRICDKCFVARHVQILQTIEHLHNRKHVNIWGFNGIGKSEFIKQVGYFLYQRYEFKDGIFYIPLNGRVVTEALKEINPLGKSEESHLKNQLRNKEMLVILDDADELFQAKSSPHLQWLAELVQDCKGLIILVGSVEKIQSNFITFESLNIPPLDPKETASMLMSMSRNIQREEVNLFDSNKTLVEALANHSILKSMRGFPSRIAKLAQIITEKNISLSDPKLQDLVQERKQRPQMLELPEDPNKYKPIDYHSASSPENFILEIPKLEHSISENIQRDRKFSNEMKNYPRLMEIQEETIPAYEQCQNESQSPIFDITEQIEEESSQKQEDKLNKKRHKKQTKNGDKNPKKQKKKAK